MQGPLCTELGLVGTWWQHVRASCRHFLCLQSLFLFVSLIDELTYYLLLLLVCSENHNVDWL